MALYFYFNETTGDLVYSDQASYADESYTALGEQTNMNPTSIRNWAFDSFRFSIASVKWDEASGRIEGLTSMRYMFYNCSDLTSLDLSGFDTSQVTSMDRMFGFCSGLTSLDMSGFDTFKVTNMYRMFSGCSSLTSLDLSGFDTSKVTDMTGVFSGCSSLRILAISGSMSNVLSALPETRYYPAGGGAAVASADLTAGTWIRDLEDRDLLTSLAQQSAAFKALSDRLGKLEEKVLGSSQAPSYGSSAPSNKLTSIVAQAQAVMSLRRRITALAKQAVKTQ